MEDAASASAGVMLGGAGRPVPFPVVFFDGECETGIGELVVHPAMDFKAFQSILSRKIGISPHQFTVYITDGNNPRNRVPVTGKVDFSAVSRENDCFFLVVLKRSRRWRTRRGRKVEPSHATKKEPPANAMLLRRGDGGGNNSTETGVFAGLDELERRVRDLQMEKERYLATLGSANLRIARESRRLVCEECENAKDVGFHRCVYDRHFRVPVSCGPDRQTRERLRSLKVGLFSSSFGICPRGREGTVRL